MSPTSLIPQRQYAAMTDSAIRTFTFIRRDRQPCRSAVNIFQCDDYRGLNGPDDKGITHLTDYQVTKIIQPIAAK